MPGLAPELPLRRDVVDGYKLIKTFGNLARQNLKMLVLTAPGERIMDPDFGVGLRHYFFENNSPGTYSEIESDIRSQVSAYLPYINILNVRFNKPDELAQKDNLLSVQIEYIVNSIQVRDKLEVMVNLTSGGF